MITKSAMLKLLLVCMGVVTLHTDVFADSSEFMKKDSGTNGNSENYENYWTEERMKSAKPAPMPEMPGEPENTPALGDDNSGQGSDQNAATDGMSEPGQAGGSSSTTDQ